MKQILEPLARISGVRIAALVTPDGVPMAVHGTSVQPGQQADEEVAVLAALATGWVGDVNRATAPLSWDAPRHLVLRATRGTLVAMQAPGALLLLVLEGGMGAEELRPPTEAAVARMQRHLKAVTNRSASSAPASNSVPEEPAGIFPARFDARTADQAPEGEVTEGLATSENGVPELERE